MAGWPLPAGAHPSTLLLCRSWVLVSWIWALIWHMPLDLIKWIMAYILNEDGFRQRIHGKKPTNIATETANVDLPDQAWALMLHHLSQAAVLFTSGTGTARRSPASLAAACVACCEGLLCSQLCGMPL